MRLRINRSCWLPLAIWVFAIPAYGQGLQIGKAPSPAAGSMFVYPERIGLKDGGFFTAHRGLAFVPINRQDPDAAVIAVEFYRFPRSAEADPTTPPLFLLRGGPGFAGLQEELERRGTFEQRVQHLLDMTDVVVVGQRGIGSSKPSTVIRQPSPPFRETAESVQAFRDVLATERDYWIDQGLDLSGFNVEEAATDVRDVAAGLGYEQIVISGGSFGSHWGMTLMRNHPDLVARAVLHGMEGPDHTWDHPGWIWNVYKRVAEDAEAADGLQSFIPEGGLIQAVESMVAEAASNPVQVKLNAGTAAETVVELDAHAMRFLARGMRNSLRAWPSEVIEMSQGKFENAARRYMMRSRISPVGESTASYWMLDSSSGITASRRAQFEADPAMSIIGSTFGMYALGSPVWPADLGDEFRQNIETSIPAVIVQGTWDTSTPYENALELAPGFQNHRMVTVIRGSHGAISEAREASEEFRKALDHFIVTGDYSGVPETVELEPPRWRLPELDESN